jgi:hypothetical protein
MQSVEWFGDHDVAASAPTTPPSSASSSRGRCRRRRALHLVEMGMTQGQNSNLEDLAADCAAEGRYRFPLSATPEPVTGGTGAPIVPVVLK